MKDKNIKSLMLPRCVASIVGLCLVISLPTAEAKGKKLALVVDAPLAPPAARALADLQETLKKRGFELLRQRLGNDGRLDEIIVGVAGSSPAVDRLIAEERIDLPTKAESLCLQKLMGNRLLIAGSDARGLSYALLEAARALELAPEGQGPLAAVPAVIEAPFLAERSMTMHLFNADLETSWYFDEDFWRDYFKMLASNRYNNFTLTFSDQTNYLTPIYAFLVDVPGYADVRVKGLTREDRARNLRMLRRIAELARERGLDFTLGIWAQLPVPEYPGSVLVENLPRGRDAADYCARGLKSVLQACPAISGVQFRMNQEAGVPEDEQAAFFTIVFQAIRACGRPMRVDLRFKALLPATIQAALAAGLRVTVSFKFWCEHMGLPYHPTVADRRYRESRYSYGAALATPRDYRVVYQLWSVGSQRLLLWGDPEYAARFARSCRLGDGAGFEVFAPLTNRGYGNEPGAWPLFADRSYQVGRWDHERYWFFYLTFGRLGYNPETDPEVWRRELRHRFGEAAADIELAYRHASQIIPLITATHLPSAGEWRWWPEMDTGGRLPEYQHVQPSDTAQFYAIRAWRRTPGWVWEEWDATIPGYAEDALAGRLQGKMLPPAIARKLLHLAEQTDQSLARADARLPASRSAECRGTQLDLHVLADLARYHAGKMNAATHLAFFELNGDTGRLPAALQNMNAAGQAWRQLVQRTDNVYHDNLVFGIPRGSPRSRAGHHHGGHWKDRMGELEADVAYLKRLLQQHGGEGKQFRTYPGETPLGEEPQFEHRPIAMTHPGVDLTISARVRSQAALRQVMLHYRAVDQTAEWQQLAMQRRPDGQWQATVPGKHVPARWDFMYYLEAQLEAGGGWIWPSWEQGPPYVVVKVKEPGD